MARGSSRNGFTSTLAIQAPADAILAAFFAHESLVAWWHISRSLCVPRTLGCYAIEWPTADAPDPTLGRLGGVFHGTVVAFDPTREFFVADAYWMAPDGNPLGPMAFEVTCTAAGDGTTVQVRQSGSERGPRGRRYFELAGEGMDVSLHRLKALIESSTRA